MAYTIHVLTNPLMRLSQYLHQNFRREDAEIVYSSWGGSILTHPPTTLLQYRFDAIYALLTLLSTEVISTLSNVVFEHLPVRMQDQNPTQLASETKEKDQSPNESSQNDSPAAKKGDKEARKQWEQGEGAQMVDLLQCKQLQTATYAVSEGSTGNF